MINFLCGYVLADNKRDVIPREILDFAISPCMTPNSSEIALISRIDIEPLADFSVSIRYKSLSVNLRVRYSPARFSRKSIFLAKRSPYLCTCMLRNTKSLHNFSLEKHEYTLLLCLLHLVEFRLILMFESRRIMLTTKIRSSKFIDFSIIHLQHYFYTRTLVSLPPPTQR